MRRRSEAAVPEATAAVPGGTSAGITMLVCGETSCGLKQSASMVLRTGKCIRCGKPMTAPAGTPATKTGDYAAEQVAKLDATRPLGTRKTPPDDPDPWGLTPDALDPVESMDLANGEPPVSPLQATADADQAKAFYEEDPFEAVLPPAAAPPAAPQVPTPTRTRSQAKSPPAGAQAPPQAPPPDPGIRSAGPTQALMPSGGEDEVSVTWAEEAIQLAQFCTFRVGPFSASRRVPAGMTASEVARAINDELTAFAEAERARKIASYSAELKRAGIQTRGG